MDLRNIVECDGTSDVATVNQRLREGWVLLAVAAGQDDEGHPSIWYSLGYPEEDDGEGVPLPPLQA
ncbi:hypothetical protein [Coralloluteibacterium thermophilus]|uniref:Uncharacterized protein n=1 Tax=Coralloluteibacterium thermophilum TaxID=2707049 RepID=A0ABV9NKR1_9GAMM